MTKLITVPLLWGLKSKDINVVRGSKDVGLGGCLLAAGLKDRAIFHQTVELSWYSSFALLSKSSPETICATILLVDISEVAALLFG